MSTPVKPPSEDAGPQLHEQVAVALAAGFFACLFGAIVSIGFQRLKVGLEVTASEAPWNRWMVGLSAGAFVGLASAAIIYQTIDDGSFSERILRLSSGILQQMQEASVKATFGGLLGGLLNGWVTATSLVLMGKREPEDV
jgi:hypothetical protein